MKKQELSDTQPTRVQKQIGEANKLVPPNSTQPRKKGINRSTLRVLIFTILVVSILGFSLLLGSILGVRSGIREHRSLSTMSLGSSMKEQFDLAIQDMTEGRFEVAQQRFEYILQKEPAYPGAAEKLAEVMVVVYATATPTAIPATTTATPTPDTRPLTDQFESARASLVQQSWNSVIELLSALRKADVTFQPARIDGMLYIALRYRGLDKIWKEGNLEGGIYDLALANKFGPLDVQSNSARELARLYIIGSSFWEVYPEQAIQYFSQVAAAAPGLRDISGWTAAERYREVLIQYGDQLFANKDWCRAQEQYQLALNLRADEALQVTLQNATLQCSPPSATPQTLTPTLSPTVGDSTVPTTQVPSPTSTLLDIVIPTDTLLPTTAVPPESTPILPTEIPPSPTVVTPPTVELPSPTVETSSTDTAPSATIAPSAKNTYLIKVAW